MASKVLNLLRETPGARPPGSARQSAELRAAGRPGVAEVAPTAQAVPPSAEQFLAALQTAGAAARRGGQDGQSAKSHDAPAEVADALESLDLPNLTPEQLLEAVRGLVDPAVAEQLQLGEQLTPAALQRVVQAIFEHLNQGQDAVGQRTAETPADDLTIQQPAPQSTPRQGTDVEVPRPAVPEPQAAERTQPDRPQAPLVDQPAQPVPAEPAQTFQSEASQSAGRVAEQQPAAAVQSDAPRPADRVTQPQSAVVQEPTPRPPVQQVQADQAAAGPSDTQPAQAAQPAAEAAQSVEPAPRVAEPAAQVKVVPEQSANQAAARQATEAAVRVAQSAAPRQQSRPQSAAEHQVIASTASRPHPSGEQPQAGPSTGEGQTKQQSPQQPAPQAQGVGKSLQQSQPEQSLEPTSRPGLREAIRPAQPNAEAGQREIVAVGDESAQEGRRPARAEAAAAEVRTSTGPSRVATQPAAVATDQPAFEAAPQPPVATPSAAPSAVVSLPTPPASAAAVSSAPVPVAGEVFDATANGERIVRAITARFNGGNGTMRLQLDPPNLGRVEVAMTMGRQGVRLTVLAGSHQAAQVLGSELGHLREAIESHGLTVNQLSGQAPRAEGSAASQQPGREGNQQSNQNPGGGQNPSQQQGREGRRDDAPRTFAARLARARSDRPALDLTG